MRVLVATDAWHPQVNGVVRTLTSLARSAQALGVSIDFLSTDGFRTVPVPTYPGLRLALPSRGQIGALAFQEVGLEGANGLDPALVQGGSILINLDSEEDGRLTVGCAGSPTARATCADRGG